MNNVILINYGLLSHQGYNSLGIPNTSCDDPWLNRTSLRMILAKLAYSFIAHVWCSVHSLRSTQLAHSDRAVTLLERIPLLSLSLGFSETPNLSQQFVGLCFLFLVASKVGSVLMWPCIACCKIPSYCCKVFHLLFPSHFPVLWVG